MIRISATPLTCDKKGFTVYSAICFMSMAVKPVLFVSRVYPITGRMEGFILSTVICTPGGRSFLISEILDSIRCWLKSTLASQSMNAEISQLPRLVILLISARSGTRLMAFSRGFVTVTIILFTGCNPASAMIFILGKVISGNKEV